MRRLNNIAILQPDRHGAHDNDKEMASDANAGGGASLVTNESLEHLPGAHAFGPLNNGRTVDKMTEDQTIIDTLALGTEPAEPNADVDIKAESCLVDENAEDQRLEQQIMMDAPIAISVDNKWQNSRIFWVCALILVAVALALGLGLRFLSCSNVTSFSYNVECVSAILVKNIPFKYNGNIKMNTTVVEIKALRCFIDSRDKGNWFLVRGTGSCMSASAVVRDGFDTELSVYQEDCNELHCLHTTSDIEASKIFWSSTLQSYYVLATGALGSIGQYELTISVSLMFVPIQLIQPFVSHSSISLF